MADVDAARRALEEVLGPTEVLSDPLALAVYARDASMLEGECALVAFPREVDHIVACVRAAAEHGLSVVPRGAGTGLAGGATPVGDALVVVTTKMDRIVEVRIDDRL
ncbi:MAG TPA: FAD-binding protein, partial [Actinomycetota bacterium]|nr:FAD-binding protein [Actinomycetota bacterium]